MKCVILMTACIVPNTDDVLAIKNQEIRKSQYLDAIHWYLNNTSFDIIFCENSGTDISDQISSENSDRIEFLTFKSKADIPDRGKGYKEMQIIEYAINNSDKFRRGGYDFVIKATGRLILKNICKVANYYKDDSNIIGAWISLKYSFADSRFFIASPDFFYFFIKYKERVNKKSNFEDNLFKAITDWKAKGNKFKYPNHWHDICGIGGGYGTVYNLSWKKKIFLDIKNILYIVLFNLNYWPSKEIKYE